MTFSLNNRLILEPYVKEALKKEIIGGIASPGQRTGVKGLRVLVPTTLSDGRHVPSGSVAYIKEETLNTFDWATKLFSCDTVPGKFLIADLVHVEFISTPNDAA